MPNIPTFDEFKAQQPAGAPPSFDEFKSQPEPEGFFKSAWNALNPIPALERAVGTKELEGIHADVSNGRYKDALLKAGEYLSQGPAGRMGKDIVEGSVQSGKNAVTQAKSGDLTGAAISGVGAVPIVGPPIAKTADQVRAGNYSGAAGTAVGTILPMAVGAGAKALLEGPAVESAATALRSSAENQYSRALNATTRGNKARSARVVPELIDRGVTSLSIKGLQQKSFEGLSNAAAALDDAYDGLPEGTGVPLKDVQKTLMDAARENFTVPTKGEVKTLSGAPASDTSPSAVSDLGMKHAEDIAGRLRAYAVEDATTGDLTIPVDTARKLRQFYDKVANASGRYDAKPLADYATGEIHGMAADSIRQHLNQIATGDSTIGDLNREYSFWKDVNRVTSDTIMRRQGQAQPLGWKLAKGAGTIAGGAGGGIKGAVLGRSVMDAIERATSSVGWQTASAVLKDRLASAIASGEPTKASFYAQKIQSDKAVPSDTIKSSEPVDQGAGAVRAEGEGTPAQGPIQPSGGPSPQETRIPIPGEARAYQARYALRELEDVQASHSGISFNPNNKYRLKNDRDYLRPENQEKILTGAMPGKFDPSMLVTDNPDATNGPPIVDSQGNALGGNGRTMILHRVYAQNQAGAQAYRDMLTRKAAQFGVDPQQLAGMKRPVLVREISDEDLAGVRGKQNAVTDLNKTPTAALRGAEQSIADSRRISQDTLDLIGAKLDAAGPESTLSEAMRGNHGPEILNKLIDDGVISPQERARYQSGGELTDAGRERISKLMVGRFFRDAAQIDRLPKPIVAKLERLAAPAAKSEIAADWNLTGKLQEAIDLIEDARARGRNLDDFINQRGVIHSQSYSPEAIQLAKLLQKESGKTLVDSARKYAEDAQFAAKGPGLFGEPPKQADSFKELFQR